MTYRHGGHSRADPGKYRPDDELQAWLAKDPVPTYRARLEAAGVDVADAGRDRSRRGGQGRRRRAGGAQRAGARPGRARDPGLGRRRLRRGGQLTVSRGDGRRDRAGDGARPVGGAAGRGRRRGRRRVQADRGPVRPVRAGARPRHADQRAGHRGGGDGGGDDRAAAGRGADVQRLLRRDLGHGRQPDRQDALHDRRPGLAAARDPHGERRRASGSAPSTARRSRTGRWRSRA